MEGIPSTLIYQLLSILIVPFRPIVLLGLFEIQFKVLAAFVYSRSQLVLGSLIEISVDTWTVYQSVYTLTISVLVFFLILFLEWNPSPMRLFSQSHSPGFVSLVTLHKVFLGFEFLLNNQSYHKVWDNTNFIFALACLLYAGIQKRVHRGFTLAVESSSIVMVMIASLFTLFHRNSQAEVHPITLVVFGFLGVSLSIMIYQMQVTSRWQSISKEKIVVSKSSVYDNILQMFSVCENGTQNEKMLLINWLLTSLEKLKEDVPSKSILNQELIHRFQTLVESTASQEQTNAYLLELIGRYIDEIISKFSSSGHFNLEEFYILRIYFFITFEKFAWKTVAVYFHFQKSVDLSHWSNKILSYKLLWELMTTIKQTNTSSKAWYKVNLHKNIKADRLYVKLTELIKDSLVSSRSFLLEFQRPNLCVSEAFDLYQEFYQRYRNIKKMAENILSLGIFCKDFFLVYSNYLRLVVHDIVEAEKLKLFLHQNYVNPTILKRKLDLILQNHEFTDTQEKFYISIDGNAKKLGLITNVSADCIRALKRLRKEFNGIHIDSLKPKFLEGCFKDKVMTDLKNESCLLNTTMRGFIDIYVDADRYLIPTKSCIKRYVDTESALQYIIVSNILRDPSDKNEFLFTFDWRSGTISNWSSKPSQFFGLDSLIFDSQMLQEQELNINMFFPELKDLYEEQLRLGSPVILEMNLTKFIDIRLTISQKVQTHNQIRTGAPFHNSMLTSLKNLNRIQAVDFSYKNFDDEPHSEKNIIQTEVQLLSMFKKSNREYGLLRCRKYEKEASRRIQIASDSFSDDQSAKMEVREPTHNLLNILTDKDQGNIPANLTVFFRSSGSQSVLKSFYAGYLVVLVVFFVIMIGKIQVYFDQMTTTYEESNTIGKCSIIALNRIKKDDFEHLLMHNPDDYLKLYTDKYYVFQGQDAASMWKSIEQSYLSLLANFYKMKGASYSHVSLEYIQSLSTQKSLLMYPRPVIEDFEGYKIPLSFTDLNSFIQITFLKIDDPSFGYAYDFSTRRFYKDILDKMHEFWKSILNSNLLIFKECLNEFQNFQLIELCLLAFLLFVCMISTEIIEFRMNKLFYSFAYFSKREINAFLAHSSNFENLLDPRKPVSTELSTFRDNLNDSPPKLIAKNSSLNSEGDDEQSILSHDENQLVLEKAGTRRSAGFLKTQVRERQFRTAKVQNDRIKYAQSQSLRPKTAVLNRILIIILFFSLATYLYHTYVQNVFNTNSLIMAHFFTVNKLTTHLEIIKYHAHFFMFLSNCTECQTILEQEKFEIVESFKSLIIQVDKIEAPGFDEYIRELRVLSLNLCKQKFQSDHLNQMLEEDCEGNYVLNQGFETYTINIADKYTKIIHQLDIDDLKIEILIKEFWIHHSAQAIIKSFGSALENMKSVQQFTVVLIKILFIVLAAAFCFIILQYRFRREIVQLEQNRFALNFMLSPIDVFNQSLREFFGKM